MRTNIDIDDTLMKDAMEAMGLSTKKETVESALKAVVQTHQRKQAIKALWGIGWEGDLDQMRRDWSPDDPKL